MHRLKVLTLTLFAVFALAAVASASASAALPEFVPSEGGFPIAFNGSSATAPSAVEIATGAPFGYCTGYGVTGEITGAKSATLTLEVKSCHQSERYYHTEGAKEGTLVLPCTANVVYIKKATKQVGLLVKLPAPYVTVLTESGIHLGVRGSILVPVTPVNTRTSTLKIAVHASKNKPEVNEYENEQGEIVKAHLESEPFGGGWWASALHIEGEPSLSTAVPVTLDA